MDEIVLLKSKGVSKRKIFFITLIPGLILLLLTVYFEIAACVELLGHTLNDNCPHYLDISVTFFVFAFISLVIGVIIYHYCANTLLTITNDRVYGITIFGKRVNLPINAIFSVKSSFLKGIDIASSSGKIHFKLIENKEEMYLCIKELISAGQKNT